MEEDWEKEAMEEEEEEDWEKEAIQEEACLKSPALSPPG